MRRKKEMSVIRMMNVTIQYVRGHMEIYGENGEFLFSADSRSEIDELLEELTA